MGMRGLYFSFDGSGDDLVRGLLNIQRTAAVMPIRKRSATTAAARRTWDWNTARLISRPTMRNTRYQEIERYQHQDANARQNAACNPHTRREIAP
jgi:hypothetical protein